MVLTLTEALLSCPSVTPDDAGCQNILSDRLKHIGFQCETLPFHDVTNLWARYGQQGPLLVFAGHTDVVPPGNEANWITPPFTPLVKDGKLYGRGVADMKGAIAAMVIATEKFIAKHPTFPGSIAFLITSDEEGPAIHGTQKVIEVLEKRHEKIDYCIVGEPCSQQTIGDYLSIGRRGSLHGKLTIIGKQGHIARPNLANNPIHSCLAALRELKETQWDDGNTYFPPTSFQFSNIHSGTGALNVIPGELTCHFNFRYANTVTAEMLQERIEHILHQHKLSFKIDWNSGALPFLTKQGKLLTAAQTALNHATGHPPQLGTGGGTSDARFIAQTGAEVIELGALCHTAHHVNECVPVQDLEKLVVLYRAILENLFWL